MNPDYQYLDRISFQVCSCCIVEVQNILNANNRINSNIGLCNTGKGCHEVKDQADFWVEGHYHRIKKTWFFKNDERRRIVRHLQRVMKDKYSIVGE